MDIHDWFLSLPEGEQKVLNEDRWMLAARAWKAALTSESSPGAEVPCSDGLVGTSLMKTATLLDEVVFRGNNYPGGKTVKDGIITLISKKGLQVQIKVAAGQKPEQTFIKWGNVLELRKTN